VDGVAPPQGQGGHEVDKAYVDPGFFEAVGIPLLRGRNFSESDRTSAPRVAIVNEALARTFWPGDDPIGRTMRQGSAGELTVVGVARDVKVRDLGESPQPFVYLPYGQNYSAQVEIIARTGLDPRRTALDLVAAVRELDPEILLHHPRTMERHLDFVLLPFRLSASILSVFALLAVALASVGLYGIVVYSVSQRTREVGIRMALGASVRGVTFLLMRSGIRVVAAGCAAGLVIAFPLSRTVSSLLFGIDARDALTFVVAPLILIVVTALAAYVAAHRVSRIHPASALKAE